MRLKEWSFDHNKVHQTCKHPLGMLRPSSYMRIFRLKKMRRSSSSTYARTKRLDSHSFISNLTMKSLKRYVTPLVAAGMIAGSSTLMAVPVLAQSPTTFQENAGAQRGTLPPFGLFGIRHLDSQAEILGISSDDLLVRTAQGKTFKETIKDLGITDEQMKTRLETLRTQRLTELKTRLQGLVSSGKITQAQMDTLITKITTPPARPAFKRGDRRGHLPLKHFQKTAPAS